MAVWFNKSFLGSFSRCCCKSVPQMLFAERRQKASLVAVLRRAKNAFSAVGFRRHHGCKDFDKSNMWNFVNTIGYCSQPNKKSKFKNLTYFCGLTIPAWQRI